MRTSISRPRASHLDETAPTNVSELLSLTSEPARILVALFVATNVLFTFATLDIMLSPWQPIIAVAMVGAAAMLLVKPFPDPFPMREALVVLVIVVVSTALVSWQLPPEGPLGRSVWHLGASTWLLFFMALRRRAGLAWLGFLLMTAVTMMWALSTPRGVGGGIGMLQTHAGILLVATLFAANLRRTSRRINDFNERAVEAAVSFAAADAAHQIRRQRVSELAQAVTPMLEQIATDAAVDEARRRDFLAMEATLRDGVRGRSLALPSVVEATNAARRRGVDVTILDDRGSPLVNGLAMHACAEQIVETLRDASSGNVTVRLLPEGRPTALSIVAHTDDRTARVDLNEQGEPLAHSGSPARPKKKRAAKK